VVHIACSDKERGKKGEGEDGIGRCGGRADPKERGRPGIIGIQQGEGSNVQKTRGERSGRQGTKAGLETPDPEGSRESEARTLSKLVYQGEAGSAQKERKEKLTEAVTDGKKLESLKKLGTARKRSTKVCGNRNNRELGEDWAPCSWKGQQAGHPFRGGEGNENPKRPCKGCPS